MRSNRNIWFWVIHNFGGCANRIPYYPRDNFVRTIKTETRKKTSALSQRVYWYRPHVTVKLLSNDMNGIYVTDELSTVAQSNEIEIKRN